MSGINETNIRLKSIAPNMNQTRKIVERKRREIIASQQVSIGPGSGGYYYFSFLIQKEGKKEHRVFFNIQVLQPAARKDLDIHFIVFRGENLRNWAIGAPSSAFLSQRYILGTLNFTPPSSDQYYAVLDNQYSILTPKQVVFSAYETWLEERLEKMKDEAIEAKRVSPESKLGFPWGIYNRLRSSQTLGLFILLLVVQVACFVVAGLIILLFNYAFGLEPKDVMGYLTTSVAPCTLVILFAVYYFITHKPLPQKARTQK